MKWFLCSVCNEWETLLSSSFVEFEDEVVCKYCFEEQAYEENDEISLMIIEMMKGQREAKMRRVK